MSVNVGSNPTRAARERSQPSGHPKIPYVNPTSCKHPSSVWCPCPCVCLLWEHHFLLSLHTCPLCGSDLASMGVFVD
jgi:hypothetical protein